MALRRITTALAFVALAGVGGALGQSLAAQASGPALTDKTLYGKVNPAFTESLTTTPGTAKTVLRITVHAPAAGQALVSLNSQLWTDFPSTTTSELTNVVTVERCALPDTFSSAALCAAPSTYWFHKPQNQSADDSTFPYSITSQLNFGGSGDRTIYLTMSGSSYNAGLWGASSAHVDVQFTPTNPIANGSHVTVAATTS